MSQHAKPTLVRIWRSDIDFIANIYVDDWETRDGWAEFTIPRTHPFAAKLFNDYRDCHLIVLDSEEIEWRLQQWHTATLDLHEWPKPPRHVFQVRCQSRRSWMRSWMPPDEWAIDRYGVVQ